MTTTTSAVATPVSADERADLMARIAKLEAKIALKPVNDGSAIKVTEKGSLSMYGLGHFPVTLTMTQWTIVAKQLPKLFLFAAANFTKLFFKTTEQHDNAAEYLNLVKK